MTARTYAPWVEPIAAQFRDGRAELVALARAMPEAAWARPSPNEGWTYKDLLAHLAGDTEKNVHVAVRLVIDGQAVDPAMFAEADAKNARDLDSRRDRSIEELVSEIEVDGEALQGLLAQLTDADEHRRQDDFPLSFGEALRSFPDHDRTHLEQLRAALEAAR